MRDALYIGNRTRRRDGLTRSLTELSTTGNSIAWQTNDHLTVASRAFERQAALRGVFLGSGKRQAVVELDRNYDVLELWVGAADGSTGAISLEIRGDGETLWSKDLHPGDKAEHLVLNIKDHHSLAFVYNAPNDACEVVLR